MIDAAQLQAAFARQGIGLFAGVPDSVLGAFSQACERRHGGVRHVVAANEGGATAMAAGWWLATRTPALVYLQNSGLGNIVNPLMSLAHPEVYAIPMVLLVGWRGWPGSTDEPQHLPQGRITRRMLELCDVDTVVLDADTDVDALASDACRRAVSRGGPVAVLVPPGTVMPPHRGGEKPADFTRSAAIEAVLDAVRDDDAIVASTGFIARDVEDQLRRRPDRADHAFYSIGSMGHTHQIACGLALALPRRRVWCLDGDGSALMHLGAMTLVGGLQSENLVHIVLDNRVHASVGGTPTCAPGFDFAALGRLAGYARVASVCDRAALSDSLLSLQPGPTLIHASIAVGETRPLGRPQRPPRVAGEAFAAFLGGPAGEAAAPQAGAGAPSRAQEFETADMREDER